MFTNATHGSSSACPSGSATSPIAQLSPAKASVGQGVAEGGGVSLGVGVMVGVRVAVGVIVSVGVRVGLGVLVGVAVGAGVRLGVGGGVGVGAAHAARSATSRPSIPTCRNSLADRSCRRNSNGLYLFNQNG